MKYVFLLTAFTTLNLFAGCLSYDIANSVCPGQKEIGSWIVCTRVKDAFKVLKASRGRKQIDIPSKVEFRDAVELGFLPDDSTDSLYGYFYALQNEVDGLVGYISIDGYKNSEAEVKIQLTTRFNKQGKLVAVSCK